MRTLVIFSMFLFVMFSACEARATGTNEYQNKEIVMSKIKFSFNGNEITAVVYDNPTARDFMSLLPVTLSFEDYNQSEKISYLSKKLSTDNNPNGFNSSIGDITYYYPWGNIAIFYKDFEYSRGLIKIGTIESGIEKLGNMKGKFDVRIEKID